MDEQFKSSLERAILSQTDATANQAVKQDAFNYCEQLKQREDIWKICLQFVLESKYDQVKLWCFGILAGFITERSHTLTDQDKDTIKQALMHWFVNMLTPRTEAFIRNKFCEALISIFRIEYYARWPTFFKDIFSILSNSPSELMIDMYLRILDTIDFEFVARFVERSEINHKRAIEIKDAMREDCIPQIISTFYTILTAKHVILSNNCLHTMSNYIDWIDINLVTTEQFVQLYYQFLNTAEFRTKACDCLCVMVEKGMNDNDKLNLITSLQIPQILMNMVIDSSKDENFAESVSTLAAAVANQLLEISSRPNQDMFLATAASKLLQDIIPFILSLFADQYDQVSSSASVFLNDFISVIKKSKSPHPDSLPVQLQSMLTTIQNKARYTEDFDFDPSKRDDYENGFLEYRRELFVLFKNIGVIAPDLVKQYVQALTKHTVANVANLNFSDVEVCLTLLFLSAEIFSDLLKSNREDNIFLPMILEIVTNNISSYPHSSVQLAYFELLSRFSPLVPRFPDDVITSMLQSFVDQRGLRNSNEQVQSRAKFLLAKFIKPLRDRLSGFVEPLYTFVKDIIQVDLPTDEELTENDSISDKFFLYEAIGFLLACQNIKTETRNKIFQEIFLPFSKNIEEVLNQKLYLSDTPEKPRFKKYISIMIRAAAILSKGFDESSNKAHTKDSVVFFKHFLSLVTRVHSELPKNKEIQSNVILYYHRMIVLMDIEILEIIPSTLSHLYQTCSEINQMKDILILLGQLIQKHKEKVNPLINELLTPTLTKIYQMINNGVYDYSLNSSSEEIREIADLHKGYFTFIHTILANNLSPVLISDTNRHLFNTVLETVFKGCQHLSVHHKKSALLCVEFFANCFANNLGKEFNDYLISNAVMETFQMLLSPDFDISDGASFNVIVAVCQTYSVFVQKFGPDFLNYLANNFLPRVPLTLEEIQNFCLTLQDIHTNKVNGFDRFKQSFFNLIQSRKKKK